MSQSPCWRHTKTTEVYNISTFDQPKLFLPFYLCPKIIDILLFLSLKSTCKLFSRQKTMNIFRSTEVYINLNINLKLKKKSIITLFRVFVVVSIFREFSGFQDEFDFDKHFYDFQKLRKALIDQF